MKVPGSPSAALTTTDVGRTAEWFSLTVRHLMWVGNPAPPRAAEAGRLDLVDDRLRLDLAGVLQPSTASAADVVVEREDRIGREYSVHEGHGAVPSLDGARSAVTIDLGRRGSHSAGVARRAHVDVCDMGRPQGSGASES